MSTTYIKSWLNDFNGRLRIGQLHANITATNIAPTCNHVSIESDEVSIEFSAALDSTDQTTFESTVSSYVYEPIPDDTISTSFEAVVSNNVLYPSDYTSVAAAFASGASSVFVRSGIYYEFADIVIPDRGQLMGESPGNTIILLLGGNSIISDAGGVMETTGTIDLGNYSKAVTGTGTTFTNLVAGTFILLSTNYYEIASIESDTALTLVDTYVGNSITNTAFRAQAMYTGCRIAQLSISSSTSHGIRLRGIRHGSIYALAIYGCNPCIELENCSDVQLLAVIPQYSLSSGLVIKSCVSISLNTFNAFNNASHGIDVSGDCVNIVLISGACENNNGCGFNVQSGAYLLNLSSCAFKNNNSDGVRLAAGVMCCAINNAEIVLNGGMGINSVAMNSVIGSCTIHDNVSHGVHVGNNGILDGNKILRNGGDGILVASDADHVLIADNSMSDNAGNGITTSGAYTIINSNCMKNNIVGIYINDVSSPIISGNAVTSNSGNGIELFGASTDAIISGNKVDNCLNGIVNSSTSHRSVITSNHVDDNTTDGIVLKSEYCVLTGNYVGNGTIVIEPTALNTEIGVNMYTTLTDNGVVDSNFHGLKINEIDSRSATTLQIGAATATKVELSGSGILTEVLGNLSIAEGCDVAGDITVSGTVDTRDIATDGGALDDHIASTANPHSVTKAQVGLTNVSDTKNNYAASVAPTATDDTAAGYSVGSMWIDTTADVGYLCVDSTTATAVWKQITA